jgi:seryl-tRNA synthetase
MLTSKTYPHGYEDVIADEMVRAELFPKGIEKDEHGNYFYKIENREVFLLHTLIQYQENILKLIMLLMVI